MHPNNPHPMQQKSTAEVRKLAVENGDLEAQRELEQRRKERNQICGNPFTSFGCGGVWTGSYGLVIL